jgi:hypothetical protein
MNGQLKEMRQETYVSCLSAQIARSTLQEIEAGAVDSHNLATGSILQAAAVTRGEAAQMEISLENNGEVALRDTGELGILYSFKNVGNTPAINVHLRMMAVVISKGSEPDFRYAPHSWVERGTVDPIKVGEPPNFRMPVAVLDGLSDKGKIFTSTESAEIRTGINKRIFFYARMDYWDIFGVKHWTQYCADARPTDLSHWKIPKCAAYTRTDTNQVIAKSESPPAPTSTPEEVVCKKPED